VGLAITVITKIPDRDDHLLRLQYDAAGHLPTVPCQPSPPTVVCSRRMPVGRGRRGGSWEMWPSHGV